jgi:hypothetical protein
MWPLIAFASFYGTQASSAEQAYTQTLSQALYYASLKARGELLCDRELGREQGQKFDRRYGRRIDALKREYFAAHGPDPTFDIALGTCSRFRDAKTRERNLKKALDDFEPELGRLEQQFLPSR